MTTPATLSVLLSALRDADEASIHAHLTALHGLLTEDREQALTIAEHGQVVAAVVPLTAPRIRSRADDLEAEEAPPLYALLAQSIVTSLPPPPTSLLTRILSDHLKPLFSPNPHPSLSTTTGRVLHRPADGQDYYEGQEWKRARGASEVLLWCVENIETDAYNTLWPLLIPPVMALLDDFEAPYKIRGVHVVQKILERVPVDLLKRTGVDSLLFQSLKTATTYLSSPYTPELLDVSIATLLVLIDRTFPASSTVPSDAAKRFEALTSVLSSIIGSVWTYATITTAPTTVQAGVEGANATIQRLGIGCARFLKALIPQLTQPLTPQVLPLPQKVPPISLRLACAHALHSVVQCAAPRMEGWRGEVVAGVVGGWVSASEDPEEQQHQAENDELKCTLREVSTALAAACPGVVDDEYRQVLDADPHMFAGLVGGIVTALLTTLPLHTQLDESDDSLQRMDAIVLPAEQETVA